MSWKNSFETKNFPMSRPSYNTRLNPSADYLDGSYSNVNLDEQIISEEDEEEELDDSCSSSDEDEDDCRGSNTSINIKNIKSKVLNTGVDGPSINIFQNVGIFQILCVLTFAVVIAKAIMSSTNQTNNKHNNITIEILRKNFPTKVQVISNIEHVINDTLQFDPTHPAVFLLLYTGNDKIVNNLTHNLALYAAKILETHTNYIDISQNEFHSEEILTDYGILIEKYKPELLDKRVMVVKDLQNIPAKVAQVFHSFCDEISPLVDRAVYLLTLKVKSLSGKEEAIAEAALNENWNELDVDILGPLVTRITSTVLKIEN